jgi:predicted nucleotidyltransferase
MNPAKTITLTIRSLESDLRAAGVANLWLFGSAARGEADVNDLDFLVELRVSAILCKLFLIDY